MLPVIPIVPWRFITHLFITEWQVESSSNNVALLSDCNVDEVYTARVSAINSAGEGPLSLPVVVQVTQGGELIGLLQIDIYVSNFTLFGSATYNKTLYFHAQVQPYHNGVGSIHYKRATSKEYRLNVFIMNGIVGILGLGPDRTESLKSESERKTRIRADHKRLSLSKLYVSTVPPQPQNFRGYAEDKKTILLNWDKPNAYSDSSMELTGYNLIYHSCDIDGTCEVSRISK